MNEKKFKLWYYTATHRQMLLRSVGENGINIDIYFGDVIYLELPSVLDGIELAKPSKEDIDYITKRIGVTNQIITVLQSDTEKYFVVSSIMRVIENQLEMFELPFDIPQYFAKKVN